ncbi:MAG: hypothetical protein ABSB76_39430 [Streptosporangiaceae bacterium]|jgi:hypothetical protein
MTALSRASELCRELRLRHASFEILIARDDAIMVSVAIPGERWEIEFRDDETIELERFVSQGVTDAPHVLEDLLAWFDE